MTDPSHERVTMAVLGTKLDYLIATVDRLVLRQDAQHERINILENKRIANIENTVRLLKWASAFVGTVAIALLVAWLKMILAI